MDNRACHYVTCICQSKFSVHASLDEYENVLFFMYPDTPPSLIGLEHTPILIPFPDWWHIWLRAGGERDDRGSGSWMASPTQRTSLSKLWETVKDREAWCTAIHGLTNTQTKLSDWTATARSPVLHNAEPKGEEEMGSIKSKVKMDHCHSFGVSLFPCFGM